MSKLNKKKKHKVILVFQWPKWDYDNLANEIGADIVIYSKNYKNRVVRYFLGSVRAVFASNYGDTIVCWYDAQAVACWWICRFLFLKRNIVCINLLLKQKPTLKNRFASYLYKKMLLARNVRASITSKAYGEWLNSNLKINVGYTLLHDVWHEHYCWNQFQEAEEKNTVFCGGAFGRDWPLMMKIAKETTDVNFIFVMIRKMYNFYFPEGTDIPSNVSIQIEIPFDDFKKQLCESKIVCLPLDCDAPQGLIVMFNAASNGKLVMTSDTPTTREYVKENFRLGKDVKEWKAKIHYYLENEEERKLESKEMLDFLKTQCNENVFSSTVKKMIDSFNI